ncbi:sister chromatid cohesion protein Dcc1 [Ephemerocybe angulata]|uniref:Sister chromatid cohesion protein Dcc1 n=1 Tax=Ephemerocybe angulata TaxID=980116 RepID=A0A8H6MAS7_9AGAR|nr:sister chromatid cohesion protein Dcc1 [Tulosesus angulatus]
MPDFDLHFSPFSTDEAASYKLIELPSELVGLLENAIQSSDPLGLVIKGDPTEDAVLCTRDKTYSIRTVNLSNTLLVVTPPPDTEFNFAEDAVVIRDQLNEILELAPAVPRISKLVGRLRGREYDETNEEDDEDEEVDSDGSSRYTYTQAREEIQASDAELDVCLTQKRILIIKDELRPISPSYLNNILELTAERPRDHGISRVVSSQVLAWFGEIQGGGKWKMNEDEVIKELGLGILREHKNDDPIEKGAFVAKWKLAVGDTFADRVSLNLLAGNYLEGRPVGRIEHEYLTYFPSSTLPTDPAARFADLFLTRTKWRVEDITPFLSDIAVNNKERDKLLLKYCRAISESGAVWYTARAQYNG